VYLYIKYELGNVGRISSDKEYPSSLKLRNSLCSKIRNRCAQGLTCSKKWAIKHILTVEPIVTAST
jgi:hypothetical protein